MKKWFFTLLAVMMCLAGCKTTSAMIPERGPIAVISVTGNQSLPWVESANSTATSDDEDDGTGTLSTLVNKVLNAKNPELLTAQDRVDYAAESFYHLLSENAGVEVIDADTLFASNSYQQTSESFLNILDTAIEATGYKNLMMIGAKPARNIMQELGAKSLIMAEFLFKKTVIKGTKGRGELGGYVVMKVRYLDEQGREVLNHEYEMYSPSTTPISNSKYSKDALVDLYPELIDTVINHFIVQNL